MSKGTTEVDLAGRCSTAEPVRALVFICMGESTNDVVELQARRTEVASAVLMNRIKLKIAQESKVAQSVTYGKSTAFTGFSPFHVSCTSVAFSQTKPCQSRNLPFCPRRETVGGSLHLKFSWIVLALLGSTQWAHQRREQNTWVVVCGGNRGQIWYGKPEYMSYNFC